MSRQASSFGGRMARDALARARAKRCETEGCPPELAVLRRGDYLTPEKWVCGRCFRVVSAPPRRKDP